MTPGDGARRRPKQARARATVDAILEGAKIAIASYGFLRATTHKIASVAGISVGTLYQYFPDKQAVFGNLLDHLSDALLTGLKDAAAEPSLESIEEIATAVLRTYVGALRDNREAVVQLLHQRPLLEGPEKLRRRHALQHAFIERALDARARLEVDHDFAAYLLLKAVWAVALNVVEERPEALDDGRLERELVRLVTAYLRSAWQKEQPSEQSQLREVC
ncbi:MAG: TetR/AcrR family transcriptional regulator [Deltaproteobacteria bacterium]|nr:TetR/AcrR family transcriptional regulator [Deltaproteobacteria bacterium]